jgi:DNA-binding response OmpR family regulator
LWQLRNLPLFVRKVTLGQGVKVSIKDLRVFIVEDEPMIRMLVGEMLQELGCSIAAEAGDIGQAVELARSAEFDLAILDINLNGKVITPVAALVRARGCPIIFATGYGSEGVPAELRDCPALEKPFQLEGLANKIEEVLRIQDRNDQT